MARFIKDRSQAKGLAPGSLVFIGKQKMDKPLLHVMNYTADSLTEKEIVSIAEVQENIGCDGVTWINVYGIHDLSMMKELGDMFDLSSLLLEDMLNTDQRPKYESYEEYDVFILKMLHYNDDLQRIEAEQFTLILGEHYVLTLQERIGDVFAPVRERIQNSKGRIRLLSNDYLAYALLDTVADHYAVTVELLGGKIEDCEEKIFRSGEKGLAELLYKHKIELSYLRKSIRPVKEVITELVKNEESFFKPPNRVYLKDLNEMITHTTEAIELYNSLISDQLNIYNTNVGNGMNQVMKVLTVFASIFIPLTFLTGIYGMNFDHIPELHYKYAYLWFWLLVVLVGGGLLLFFKKKRWL